MTNTNDTLGRDVLTLLVGAALLAVLGSLAAGQGILRKQPQPAAKVEASVKPAANPPTGAAKLSLSAGTLRMKAEDLLVLRIADTEVPSLLVAADKKPKTRTDEGTLIAVKNGKTSYSWTWYLQTKDFKYGLAFDDKKGADINKKPELAHWDKAEKLIGKEVMVVSRPGYFGIGKEKVLLVIDINAKKEVPKSIKTAPLVWPNANTTITFDTWPDAEVWLAVNPAKHPAATDRTGLPYADRAWLSLGRITEWRTKVGGPGKAEMYLAASRADGTWTGPLRVMVGAGETKTVRAK